MLAGLEAWLERPVEQVGEVALREVGTDVGAVACFLEQVCVGVESHARARVTEDPADLGDVEADVDDQVAGEGVAEIVETHPSLAAIEAGIDGSPTQHPLGDVVVQEGGATRGSEHVIGTAREAGAAFVLTENRGELGDQRDLAHGGTGLGWDAVRRHAAATTRELVTNVNDGGGEVDVLPAQPEHLGEPHTRVRTGDEQRSISAWTGGEESSELCLGEDALVGAQRMRPLVALEAVKRMRSDVAAAKREREDAAEPAEYALDRPGRETVCLQLAHDCDDVVGCDQRQPASAEPGQ